MGEPWVLLSFTPTEFGLLAVIIFVAGLVRGFSGFALSAIVMAMAATFMPPLQLIPVLWFQEMAASLLMARGGWRDADRKTVLLLVIGAWIGWPLGLTLTGMISVEASKMAALGVILGLAVLLLSRVRMPGLDTGLGTALTGALSGLVSGIAHVGGMVVALYVLSLGRAARSMRGTLVLYLFVSAAGSLFIQSGFGVMTDVAVARGLGFVPITLVGVWLGTKLFSPRWEPYYRPFCLSLLILLAAAGLARLWLG